MLFNLTLNRPWVKCVPEVQVKAAHISLMFEKNQIALDPLQFSKWISVNHHLQTKNLLRLFIKIKIRLASHTKPELKKEGLNLVVYKVKKPILNSSLRLNLMDQELQLDQIHL